MRIKSSFFGMDKKNGKKKTLKALFGSSSSGKRGKCSCPLIIWESPCFETQNFISALLKLLNSVCILTQDRIEEPFVLPVH